MRFNGATAFLPWNLVLVKTSHLASAPDRLHAFRTARTLTLRRDIQGHLASEFFPTWNPLF